MQTFYDKTLGKIPIIVNVSMPLADTEYSYDLPKQCKKFSIKLRSGTADYKVGFVSGGTYKTIDKGVEWCEDRIDPSYITLYFQSPTVLQIAEIVCWS